MKKLIVIFLVISLPAISQEKLHLYPETINVNDFRLELDSLAIKEFKEYLSTISEIDFYKIEAFDFNNDNTAEYFAYYSDGSSFLPFYIYRKDLLHYESVGEFEVYTSTFAELKNGMPQIIRTDYEGEKTNPIYYPKVYSFQNDKYVLLLNPHLRIGEYRNLGLDYYKNRKYKEAAICYLNVLKPIWGMARVSTTDYNNLALVYLKMGKLDKAKDILDSNINIGNKDAITYFNLAMVEEKLNNKPKALEYYEQSNDLKPMKIKEEKIKELKNNR